MLDIADQLAIQDLFANYCHRVDHGDAAGWVALFAPDGSFEVAGALKLEGADRLTAMPGIVAQQGNGKWRHQITNIVARPGDDERTAHVVAYGLVTDWQDGGKPASFTDYDIMLRRMDGEWRIARLVATLV
ncbi:nuclear transport factor 2 family protein [Sphingomonas sp. CGMCC 1.13654]|uniref:Nuclear transport factor 2 family protein n=1 Tax=Sphingomonas chungangi TaxID=2683589 RepID=A0A838L288_9SPHN|nr:nuclear transport factor 2 family protein [Sphingomonas chungangi]MBA2933613.1 nuclear transport factor 2 family protein [Sphingomonas chungangi]MVW54946.1 hypothetical protein [Sphingomonas chungangi]